MHKIGATARKGKPKRPPTSARRPRARRRVPSRTRPAGGGPAGRRAATMAGN